MSTVLISILSEHSVPNFLFMKELAGEYDKMVFVTTQQIASRQRGQQLERAMGLKELSVPRVVVESDDYKEIRTQLETFGFDDGNYYLVNLTGGTKMMSIATHDFFMRKNASFYYVPIGKNTYYNLATGENKPLNYRITLKEYFTLYGLFFENNQEFLKPADVTLKLFSKIARRNFYLPFRFIHAQEEEDPVNKRYYGGEWFEEYTYLRLKQTYRLDDEHIARSVRIFRNEEDIINDNELDVAFLHNNTLYVVECKVTMYGPGRKIQQTVESYLYKLAAVSKDFGLIVNPYLFTLHHLDKLDDKVRENINKRCRILGVRGIIGPDELSKPTLNL
jgi:hypothetical protein